MSKWTPQNDEPAMTLAAIRWYGMSVEKLAMDLYVTNKEQYPAVKAILSTALIELGRLRGYCAPDARKAGSPSEGHGKPSRALHVAESYKADRPSAPSPQPMSAMAQSEDDGCAPGYVNCNGVCLPDCDNIAEY